MRITWEEAWKISSEIVEILEDNDLALPHLDGRDPVERLAEVVFEKDGMVWTHRIQQWIALGPRRGGGGDIDG